MSIADWTEGEYAAHVSEALDRSRLGILVRQLQGDPTLHVVGTSGEPAFANGWANFDVRTAAFYRDGPLVRLRGVIAGGTVSLGSPAFVLPVGFRPALEDEVLQPVVATSAFGAVYVSSTGGVSVFVGTNTFVDLSPVCFRVSS